MSATESQPQLAPRAGRLALAAAAVLVVVAACIPGPVRNPPASARSGPVRVIGTLVVNAGGPDGAGASEIELPDARVFLEGADGTRSAQASTGLDGRFELRAPAPGRYRLCYEIGLIRGCGPTVAALGGTALVERVAVAAPGFIHGQVLTGDGRPCWISDSFFGLDVSTQVSAASGNGRAQASTRANTQGEYVLTGLRPGAYRVTARCEEATAGADVDLRSARATQDLTLPNRAPEVQSAAAFDGNRARTVARTGAALDLRAVASDPDGDSIRYMWRTLDGNGQIGSGSASTTSWRLPSAPGLRSVYLMARDGRGGFTYRRIDMESALELSLTASGQAIDEVTGAPVAGAEVTFGSERGFTDANGWFAVESAVGREDRYVLNIRHPRYSLISRILDRSARGNSYEMIPMQTEALAADAPIRIADRTSGSLCGRPGGEGERRPVRRVERRVIGAGRQTAATLLAQARAAEPRCLERGAEIEIPAGALVDARGARARGPVNAAVATLDPTRRALAGDYQARGRNGEPAALVSFGAVDIRFSDAQGRPLNLRPGTAARVRIPVPPNLVANARSAIAMWSYDEGEGRWVAEGEARLERTEGGAFFVGETRHFSMINMDIELNVANATCVRFQLDNSFNGWSNLVMRAYVTFGTSSQLKEVALDSNPIHGVFTLPYGPGNTLRLELRGTSPGATQQVLLDDIIALNLPRAQMTGTNLFPPYPYDECGPLETLSSAGVIPYYGDIDATGRPAFLTGPYGTFNPNQPQTAAYYAAVDSGNLRTTLGGWWQANGFGLTGQPTGAQPYAHAAYMNHNDLGFGRDMHCIEPGGGKLACYVTNYGLPDQNSQNADDAASQNPLTRGATVAMEYDPAGTPNNTQVQFYVFGGGDQNAPRIDFADLDGLGPKPVPNLCMVCHGGNLVDVDPSPIIETPMVEWARFREFDLPSFRYPANQSWDFLLPAPSNLNTAQFGQLNRMVHDIHPSAPVGDLIQRWYHGNYAQLPNQLNQLNPPPPGWDNSAQERAAYNDVYARSCRTCHLARDEGNANKPMVFNSHSQFTAGYVMGRVCGLGTPKRRVMPNAYVTYRNFWANPNLPQNFAALYGSTGAACGN